MPCFDTSLKLLFLRQDEMPRLDLIEGVLEILQLKMKIIKFLCNISWLFCLSIHYFDNRKYLQVESLYDSLTGYFDPTEGRRRRQRTKTYEEEQNEKVCLKFQIISPEKVFLNFDPSFFFGCIQFFPGCRRLVYLLREYVGREGETQMSIWWKHSLLKHVKTLSNNNNNNNISNGNDNNNNNNNDNYFLETVLVENWNKEDYSV